MPFVPRLLGDQGVLIGAGAVHLVQLPASRSPVSSIPTTSQAVSLSRTWPMSPSRHPAARSVSDATVPPDSEVPNSSASTSFEGRGRQSSTTGRYEPDTLIADTAQIRDISHNPDREGSRIPVKPVGVRLATGAALLRSPGHHAIGAPTIGIQLGWSEIICHLDSGRPR